MWSRMAIIILFFFPVMIYSVTLESIFEGQTIGKKLVKIKVVKIDGYQASFGDYLIRWLFRIIENNMLGWTYWISSNDSQVTKHSEWVIWQREQL